MHQTTIEKLSHTHTRTIDYADKYEELMLTDKGEVVHKEHYAYHLKLAEDIISLFDPKEASGFLKALKKINRTT